MDQLTTTAQEPGISPELKDFIDQVIVPALLEKIHRTQDLKVVDTQKKGASGFHKNHSVHEVSIE